MVYSGRVLTFGDAASLSSVKFSPDGTKLITAGEDSNIVLRLTANLVRFITQAFQIIPPISGQCNYQTSDGSFNHPY